MNIFDNYPEAPQEKEWFRRGFDSQGHMERHDKAIGPADYGHVVKEESGASGGHATHKPRMDLLPWGPLDEVGSVFGYGERKHGANNWQKGLPHSAHLASAIRHLSALLQGEGIDPESDHSHAAHAVARLLMYMDSQQRGLGVDDVLEEESWIDIEDRMKKLEDVQPIAQSELAREKDAESARISRHMELLTLVQVSRGIQRSEQIDKMDAINTLLDPLKGAEITERFERLASDTGYTVLELLDAYGDAV